MKHKSVLVIGGTRGVGAALVKGLVDNNVRVTYTGRTTPNSPWSSPLLDFIQSDLSTFKQAWELGEKLKFRDFDTAVLTVRVHYPKEMLTRTFEDVETTLAVNYMSRFVLMKHFTNFHLFPKLQRVFIFGRHGEEHGPANLDDINFEKTRYRVNTAVANTSILNEALVYETTRRHPHLEVIGLNPGMLDTGQKVSGSNDNGERHQQQRHTWMKWLLEKTIGVNHMTASEFVEETAIPLLANDDLPYPACYSRKGEIILPTGWVAKEQNRKRCWEISEELMHKVLKD